jgi:hypothetical protein
MQMQFMPRMQFHEGMPPPTGAVGDEWISLGMALGADVPGAGARYVTPLRTALDPANTTNRPALARSAISDLPMFVITYNCRCRTPGSHERSTQVAIAACALLRFE